MTNSQNGWPASSDPKQIDVVSFKVGSVSFPNGVKAGDVHTVLNYVATQFGKTVEKLMSPGCWGYDYKKIDGSNSLSNHSSGTAIDLNAPHHPMGSSGTFGTKAKTAIHKIIADCDGVVKWGGDYTGRKDEMHFEIVGNAAAVKKLADKLGGSTSTPPASNKLLVDGVLGKNTITRWQQVMKTPVDGVISDPSDLVKAVQEELNKKLDGTDLVVDGEGINQDDKITKTVTALQKYLGTPVDGKLSLPVSDAVKALQTKLNAGSF